MVSQQVPVLVRDQTQDVSPVLSPNLRSAIEELAGHCLALSVQRRVCVTAVLEHRGISFSLSPT